MEDLLEYVTRVLRTAGHITPIPHHRLFLRRTVVGGCDGDLDATLSADSLILSFSHRVLAALSQLLPEGKVRGHHLIRRQ